MAKKHIPTPKEYFSQEKKILTPDEYFALKKKDISEVSGISSKDLPSQDTEQVSTSTGVENIFKQIGEQQLPVTVPEQGIQEQIPTEKPIPKLKTPELKAELADMSSDVVNKIVESSIENIKDPKEKEITEKVINYVESQWEAGGTMTPTVRLMNFEEATAPINEKHLSMIGDRYPTEEERDAYIKELEDVADEFGLLLDNNSIPFVPKETKERYKESLDRACNRISKGYEDSDLNSFGKDFAVQISSGLSGFYASNLEAMGIALAFNAIPGYSDLAEGQRIRTEQLKEQVSRKDLEIVTAVNEKEYGKAFGNTVLQLGESIPMLTALALGNAAGYGNAALGYMGAVTSAERYKEIEDIDMPTTAKIFNSLAYGGAEVLPEMFGTGAVIRSSMAAIKRGVRKEVVEDIVKMGFRSQFEKAVNQLGKGVVIGTTGGFDEASTSYMQNLLNREDPMKGVGDAFIVGVFTDVAMSTPTLMIETRESAKGFAKSIFDKLPTNMPVDDKVNAGRLLIEKEEYKKKEESLDDSFKGTQKDNVSIVDNSIKLTTLAKDDQYSVNELKKKIDVELTKNNPSPEKLVSLNNTLKSIEGKSGAIIDKNSQSVIDNSVKENTPEEIISSMTSIQGQRQESYEKAFGNLDSEINNAVYEDSKKKGVEIADEAEISAESTKEIDKDKPKEKEEVKGVDISSPKKFQGLIVSREGELNKHGEVTHFALSPENIISETGVGKQKLYDLSSDINIADITDNKILQQIKDKAKELNPENTENIDAWNPSGSERIKHPKGFIEAAKELGYDGITEFDITDSKLPTSLKLWSTDKVESRDPKDIYHEFITEQEKTQEKQLSGLEDYVLSRKINKKSFIRFGDRNKISNTIARSWFNKEKDQSSTSDIDIIAQEASDNLGIEVTPDDIIEIIYRFPSARARKTTNRQNELRRKYKDVTGKSINAHLETDDINKAYNNITDQEIKSLNISEIELNKIKDILDKGEVRLDNIKNLHWLFKNDQEFNLAKKILEGGYEQETVEPSKIPESASESISKKSDAGRIKTEEKIKKTEPEKPKILPKDLLLTKGKKITESLKRVLKTSDDSFTIGIKEKNKEVGSITIEKKENIWTVKRIDINKEDRQRNIAKTTYIKLNEQANKDGAVLQSDRADKINNESKRIWESLIKSGEATKENNIYLFKKITPTPEIKKTSTPAKKETSTLIQEAKSIEELDYIYKSRSDTKLKEYQKKKGILRGEDKIDDDDSRIPHLESQMKPIGIEKEGDVTILKMGKIKLPVTPSIKERQPLKTFSKMLGDWSKSERKKISRGTPLYAPSSGRIQAMQIRSAIHEIGHYLDDKNRIIEKIQKQKINNITDELLIFAETGSIPKEGLSEKEKIRYIKSEGIAEYFTALTLNPDEATKLAPEFTKHINNVIDKKSLDNFTRLSNDIRNFISAPASEQLLANVAIDKPKLSLSERITKALGRDSKAFKVTLIDKFIEHFGNETNIALKAFKVMLKEQGKKITDIGGRKDFIEVSRLLLGMDNKIFDFLKNGFRNFKRRVIEDNGEVINENYLFKPITKISKTAEEFKNNILCAVKYAMAKRIIELKGNLDKQQAIEDVKRAKKAQGKEDIKLLRIPSENIIKKYPELLDEIIDKDGTTFGDYIEELRSIGLDSYRDSRYNFSKAVISGSGGGFFNDYNLAVEAIKEFDNLKKENKEFFEAIKETNRRYEKLADVTLQYYRDSGRISNDEYNDIKKRNKHYISFSRNKGGELGDIEFNNFFKIKGDRIAVVSEVIKHISGGASEINNPYVSLYTNMSKIIHEADRNAALRAFTDQIDNLKRSIGEEGLNELEIAHQVEDKSDGKENGKYVIKVFKDGVESFYDISPDIYAALTNVGSSSSETNIVLNAISLPVKILERSVTSFPTFSARNKIKDVQQSLVLTLGKFSGRDFFKGKSKHISDLNAAGGGQFGFMMDKKRFYNMQSEIARKMDKNDFILHPVRLSKFKDSYMHFLEWVEATTRAGEYKRVYDEKISKGMEHADADISASFAARDLMDFAVHGSSIKWVRAFVPFLNPQIQSIRKLYRHAKTHPLKMAGNFVKFVLVPIMFEKLLLGLTDDETKERYSELSNFRKDLFFNIPLGDGWLTIPKPFEIGVIGSAVTRIFDKLFLGDDRPYDNEYMKWLASILSPIDPRIIAGESAHPVFSALRNYDSFRQRNIIPPSEQIKPLELRSIFTASRAGQAVQKLIGIDARKADYLIKGLGTYWGEWAVSLSDIGRESSKNKIDITKTGFYKKNTPYSNDNIIWIKNNVDKYGLKNDPNYKELKDWINLFYITKDKETKKQILDVINNEAKMTRKILEETIDIEVTMQKLELELKKIEHEIR